MEGSTITTQTIFKFEQRGVENGKVIGEFVATGVMQTPVVPPFGGTTGVFSTNPFSFAAPAKLELELEELSPEEITSLVDGYTTGKVPDYQVSAFLMAVFFRGMSDREVSALTDCMLRSGGQIDLLADPRLGVIEAMVLLVLVFLAAGFYLFHKRDVTG